jgi:DNA modification methylase
MTLPLGEIIHGDCLDVLAGWPAESVDLVFCDPPYNPGKVSSVWQFQPAKPNGHETPKPEDLMARIIGSTSNPGDVVCDPFTGSGTTCTMAERLNRRWVGVEQSEKYAKAARARVADVQAQLFAGV